MVPDRNESRRCDCSRRGARLSNRLAILCPEEALRALSKGLSGWASRDSKRLFRPTGSNCTPGMGDKLAVAKRGSAKVTTGAALPPMLADPVAPAELEKPPPAPPPQGHCSRSRDANEEVAWDAPALVSTACES